MLWHCRAQKRAALLHPTGPFVDGRNLVPRSRSRRGGRDLDGAGKVVHLAMRWSLRASAMSTSAALSDRMDVVIEEKAS
jgi:hypothetical protein